MKTSSALSILFFVTLLSASSAASSVSLITLGPASLGDRSNVDAATGQRTVVLGGRFSDSGTLSRFSAYFRTAGSTYTFMIFRRSGSKLRLIYKAPPWNVTSGSNVLAQAVTSDRPEFRKDDLVGFHYSATSGVPYTPTGGNCSSQTLAANLSASELSVGSAYSFASTDSCREYSVQIQIEKRVGCVELTAAADTQTFQSSGHPADYTNSLDECWSIDTGAMALKLTFEQLDLSCPGDTLFIYEGASEFAPLIQSLCPANGTKAADDVVSTSSVTYVRFATDASGVASGFKIGYKTTELSDSGCISSSVDAAQNLEWSLQKYVSPQTRSIQRCWTFTSPGEMSIQSLSFSSVSSGRGCDFRLDVYVGASTDASDLKQRYCADNATVVSDSLGKTITAQFSGSQLGSSEDIKMSIKSTEEKKSSGMAAWKIVLIVLFVILLIVIIVIIIIVILKLKKKKSKQQVKPETSRNGQIDSHAMSSSQFGHVGREDGRRSARFDDDRDDDDDRGGRRGSSRDFQPHSDRHVPQGRLPPLVRNHEDFDDFGKSDRRFR